MSIGKRGGLGTPTGDNAYLCFGGVNEEGKQVSLLPPPSYDVSEPEQSYFVRDELRSELYDTYIDSPNLEETLSRDEACYREWRDSPDFLIFKEYSPKGTRFKAVKASKRGNDVYRWRVRQRFKDLDKSLPDLLLDRSSNRIARATALFLTLTYKRNISIGEAWQRASPDYARFSAYLRKTWGRVAIIKTIAAHKDGFPHIHLAVFFKDKNWCVKRHNGSFRLLTYHDKQRFAQAWRHGFIDIKAISDPKKASHYILGHITGELKRNALDDRSLFLNWLFRKRSFSISNPDLINLCITQTRKHRNVHVDLNMQPLSRRFYAIDLVGIVKIEFFNKPPPFSINLEESVKLKENVLSVIAGIVEKENAWKKNAWSI